MGAGESNVKATEASEEPKPAAAAAAPAADSAAAAAPAAPAAAAAAPTAEQTSAAAAANEPKPESAAAETAATEAQGIVDEATGGIALCVRKLGEDVTVEKLKAAFEAHGEVISAEIKTNQEGKSRGLGIIIVPTQEEAQRVINNAASYQVDGKEVDIRLTKGRGKGRDRHQKGAGGTEGAPAPAAAAAGQAATGSAKGGKAGKGAGKGKGNKGAGSDGKASGKTSLAAAAGAPEFVPGQYGNSPEYMYDMAARQYAMYQYMMQAAYAPYMYNQAQQQAAAAAAAAYAAGGQGSPQQGAQQQSAAPAKGAGSKEKGRKGAKTGGSSSAYAKDVPRIEVDPSKVFTGKLKSVSARNGYGFLFSQEAWDLWRRDVYAQRDTELTPAGIKVEDEVTFNIVLSEKGHPQAVNVKKVS